MTTRREYAASLGLAKADGRGRLSREALAAIDKALAEGRSFSDCDSTGKRIKADVEENEFGVPKPEPRVYEKLPEWPVVHADLKEIYAVNELNGGRQFVIALTDCGCHSRHVKYCPNDVPELPAYLGGGPAVLAKPNLS